MLSKSSKYALKALTFLSRQDNAEYLSVIEIANNTAVPAAYLSKLIKALAKHRLVVTKKGINGGVKLESRAISFFEVCAALDDPIIVETCLVSHQPCQSKSPCPFHHKWLKERTKVHNFLKQLKINA